MKNKLLIYGVVAIGGYLLWRKYGKKTPSTTTSGTSVIGGSDTDKIVRECQAEAIQNFSNKRPTEEAVQTWVKECVFTKTNEAKA